METLLFSQDFKLLGLLMGTTTTGLYLFICSYSFVCLFSVEDFIYLFVCLFSVEKNAGFKTPKMSMIDSRCSK